MWKIDSMFAVDDNGNYVSIIKNKRVTISIRDAKNKLIYRDFTVKETPPCLSVAVADLIKLLAKENTA